ncbi:hypothetical protein cyc_02880 [Cyclospora cayetanensis]|uniref:Uncharacterized protein n=1 Tax=Cyclospora cayetanensis TaxID=88456 RepID=A0A1D3D1M8_9EIME|nr:hypothetical protein cyc_02880 [Cyclospora cayetanensis]
MLGIHRLITPSAVTLQCKGHSVVVIGRHTGRLLHFDSSVARPVRKFVSTVVQDNRTSRSDKPQRGYWFNTVSKSPSIELPSGKKCYVLNVKRDQDGELEPVLCFVDSQGKRLMWMDGEELAEFEKLIPRLEEYFKLHSVDKEQSVSSHSTTN